MGIITNLSMLFNNTAKDCGELYLDAVDSVMTKVSFWIIALVILVLIDFIALRLYNHGWNRFNIRKNDYVIYHNITSTTLWVKIVVVFTMFGMFFFNI